MGTRFPLKHLYLSVVFALFLFFPILFSFAKNLDLKTYLPIKTNIVKGAYLNIPVIKINVFIEDVGLTKDKAMDVPKDPDNVAWFNLGPQIGEIGSAVIDGHSGWKNNRPAIFDNLSKLKIGDKIYVKDKEGKIVTFVVSRLKNYSPKEDASNVFYSNDNQAHLNLITCSGSWDNKTKSHSTRLVVFTNKL